MYVEIFQLQASREDHHWTAFGACVGNEGDMFPSAAEDGRIARAKGYCAVCPVQRQCLDEALENGEQFGVWGGLTEQERYDLLRRSSAKKLRKWKHLEK